MWILARWDLKSDFGELHQEELVDLLTLHSLFVNSRHLSLCRHCPLLKYSKCLVLSIKEEYIVIIVITMRYLPVVLIPHFKSMSDNCSLKMRSRHNEQGRSSEGGVPLDPNKFGGYGFALS